MEDHYAGVLPDMQQVIDEIVSAVRAGDDARLRVLLVERFAPEADIGAVFALRQRLYHALGGGPDGG
ncbi:hypothetical protein [Streptomyces sp. NPDC007264]|uniref:hypothetical protein n=1 Tax=Streptomyces sp. NPDC007264 TaxID=3364777 RepID=UPI0036DDD7BD